MGIVYVREQGASLAHSQGRLLIRHGEQTLGDVPLEQVSEIVLFGRIHLTTPVMTYCLRRSIDVCFLDQQGRFLGRLSTPLAQDGRLRLDQYRLCSKEADSLEIARELIRGKLANQTAFWARRSGSEAGLAAHLRDLRDQAGQASSLEELRGVEGAAALSYFRRLPSILPKECGFPGERTRPALDPVNAMLNLGYMQLYRHLLSSIYTVGLDPYIGVFHQPHPGHATLASDLMEEFRAPIVDSLTVLLFNRREFTTEDFVTDPKQGVRFTDRALARFLSCFEARMADRVTCPRSGDRFSYRQMLEQQARQFARIVRGEQKKYLAYRWDY